MLEHRTFHRCVDRWCASSTLLSPRQWRSVLFYCGVMTTAVLLLVTVAVCYSASGSGGRHFNSAAELSAAVSERDRRIADAQSTPHAIERRLADAYHSTRAGEHFRTLNRLVGVAHSHDLKSASELVFGAASVSLPVGRALNPPLPPPEPLPADADPALTRIHRTFIDSAVVSAVPPSAAAGSADRTLYMIAQAGASNELGRYYSSPYFRCFIDAHAFRIVRLDTTNVVVAALAAEREAASALRDARAALAESSVPEVVRATQERVDAARAVLDKASAVAGQYANILLLVEFAQLAISSVNELRAAAERTGRKLSIGVYHTGDEMYGQSPRDALYSQVEYVLRLYYDSDLSSRYGERMVWMPNGWSVREYPDANFDSHLLLPPTNKRRDDCQDTYLPEGQTSMLASRRQYVYNLIAAVGHAGRSYTLKAFLNPESDRSHNAKLIQSESGKPAYQATSGGLSHADTQKAMHDSVFTIVPCGNNPETFRIYEALQTDSIPLIERCGSPLTAAATAIPRPPPSPVPNWPNAPQTPTVSAAEPLSRHYLSVLLTNAGCPAATELSVSSGGVIPCPLLVVDGYENTFEVVKPYLASLKRAVDGLPSQPADPYNIDALQRRTALWWEQFKKCIRVRVTDAILRNWITAPPPSPAPAAAAAAV